MTHKLVPYACGFPGCIDKRDIIDERPLRISFKLLKYHSLSTRTLTFEEYKELSTKECFERLHDNPLSIIEDDGFSILMQVTREDKDLERLYNLTRLMRF